MANVIKLKRGTSTPTTSDIVDGEVAIDKSAKKLYVNDGGTIKEIGGSSGVADGAITTAKLAYDAVTTAKITDANVTTAKIADSNVTTAKIADDAVTYAKIQNVSATDRILGRDSSGAGVIEEITPANLRTMINVADGANVGITDVVSDTTPQLGGDLDMNSKFISSGILGVKNQGAQSELRLYCETNNAHYAGIKAPAHADFSGDLSFILPSGYGSNGQVLQSNGSGGTSWTALTDSTKMPLTGGTFSAEVIFQKEITETVFAITDASSVLLDPINGMIQTWTLGSNRTATDGLTTGQSMLLIVTASGSNYTLNWPTMKWRGGSAPTLGGANPTAIELFKVGSQLYGATVGDLS